MYKRSYRPYRRNRFLTQPLFLAWMVICLGLGITSLVKSPDFASAKLAREGYTNVSLTGWQPLALWCDSKSGIAQGFRGRAPNGEQRSGYVCTSFFFSYIVD